ncbi:hypothetical protein N0V86_008859 [Didymella sp. IMI 355093]|nr:hypothetical protein N0V86_008859 [Didymella sp. IMI 355093]
MANEIEQTILLQPTSPVPDRGPEYTEAQQPFPQVNIQQQRLNSHDVAARVPDTAKQVQHYYAPTPPAPQQAAPTPTTAVVIAPVSVPEGAVSVVKEVILEPQPANTKRRVSFTTNTKPPVTTIQAMAAQASTLCQLNTVQESTSDGSDQSENGGVVNQHSTDRILSDWKTYLSEFDQKHDNMEDGFDPFQDVIEDAFDAKYKDLLGEGRFLVDEEEEAELPAEVPVEMPVQEVQAVPTKDANTWIAHKKAEEAFSEIRDIHTGSARRRLSASEFVVHPPKPRTYPAGLTYLRTPLCHACASPCPPVLAPVPQAALQPVGPVSIKSESTEVEQHYSTPDPVESPEPMQIEGKTNKSRKPPQWGINVTTVGSSIERCTASARAYSSRP